jgi:2-hydroxychromene-2-carboxylate isomerase
MHDKLFYGQPDWNGEATSNPKKVFEVYAKELGLDMAKWNACFDSQQHLERILSNRAEAIRRGIGETPTFVIGNRRLPGAIAYDVMKAYVDSAAKLAPAPAAAAPADTTRKSAPR